MFSKIREYVTGIELILLASGICFFISVVFMVFHESLTVNYIAKVFYIGGTILLVWRA